MGKTTRVVVCGMKGVGKTALLEQLIYGNVDKKTVGSHCDYCLAWGS
jgi:NF-kappa-B inhibitor-interacting Ras-like protein